MGDKESVLQKPWNAGIRISNKMKCLQTIFAYLLKIFIDPTNQSINLSFLPNHDVAEPQDLHHGGHTYSGEVERVHGLQLHPDGEGAGGVRVLGEQVRRAVRLKEVLH